MLTDTLQLFALNASRQFGEQVAHWLGMPVAAHQEREFGGGEHKARSLDNVRGNDVYVVQSLHADDSGSVNDKLCRLLFFIGALKDAAAARVTAVVPYLAFARKDSKTNPRDPLTLRYAAAMFEAVGTDAVLTLDVHNLSAYQNAFRCGTEQLDACSLFAKHFLPLVQGVDTVVVSPDTGGAKRANRFRHCLEGGLGKPVASALCEKYRKAEQLSGTLLVGEVAGKTAILLDDMIDSGHTLARAADACRQQGAARVFAAASHGLFSPGAARVLDDAGFDGLVVTDTIAPFRQDQSLPAHLTVESCSGLFAEAIRRMHDGGSVSELCAW
ncbi:MAG TPA: ribose-phosphate pyrophosphokinase [Ramlibacter sp.]